ncbi:MAG: hypothetical protein OEU92_30010 [Alphaproteobacteria bacterium]|nr:hypothetical protein [Alphaproteobacteria bacterium]
MEQDKPSAMALAQKELEAEQDREADLAELKERLARLNSQAEQSAKFATRRAK